ncbi:unnamed protein product [Cuscuta epithymum]|uniref:Dof zinc finger protein n=1 Tax=Cuscuta epithymum TaxID=186058 RepID=A0AAV0FIH1_9ASTE|nr:unnamed protein product [Cuscuta epithymum]
MDSSSAQEMTTQTLQSMLGCGQPQSQERKPRPADGQSLKCPRCDSANTKFCYYNNYSLSQPRYFCKSCRRYWTKGGTLRNVPVGGGCRKNKRPSASSSRCRSQDQSLCSTPPNPLLSSSLAPGALPYEPSDLSFAIARLQKQSNFGIDDMPMMCSLNNAPYGNFLESPGNTGLFQNMYYGGGGAAMNDGMMGNMESHEIGGISYDGVATSAGGGGGDHNNDDNNHEGGESDGERGLLWSFPWHSGSAVGGGGDYHHHHQSAAATAGGSQLLGGFGSSWHGLLNTALM